MFWWAVGSSGLNLRLSNSSDPEPGRCKRTDGKKWRCSRDVAPNHKYCERHLHRGRPRSRKPVEIQVNNDSSSCKRTRREDYSALSTSPVNIPIPRPAINNNGVSSQFLGPTAGSPFHRPTEVSLASHKDLRLVLYFSYPSYSICHFTTQVGWSVMISKENGKFLSFWWLFVVKGACVIDPSS